MSTRTSASPPHAEFFPPPRDSQGPGRIASMIVGDIRELIRFWPVTHNMVVQELRVRYHRSVLGFLWTLLNPILMMVTMTIFFSSLLGRGEMGDYAVYLFAGMVPWNLFAITLTDCTFCIISNEGLIRKIYVPKLVFPLTKLLINLITFSLSMVAMFLLMAPLGAKFAPALVLIPVATALFAIFSFGLGLIVAVLNTFYRDCSHLVGVFLQAWYFATPIVYMTDLVPSESRWKFWCNPAYPFVRLFQIILHDGAWPDLTTFLLAAGIAAATLGVGYAAFKSYEDKLVFRL